MNAINIRTDEKINIDRRRLVAGGSACVLGAGAAAFYAGEAVSAPQKNIATRALALAEELSMLLGELDGGEWEMRVRPPFEGDPVVSV